MAVFDITLSKESQELLAKTSNGEVVYDYLPSELSKCLYQYLGILFSCGRSKVVPWFDKCTIRNPFHLNRFWSDVNAYYNNLRWNCISSKSKWYPIRINIQPWSPPLIWKQWEECELFALDKIKGRNLDIRDNLALYNAELTQFEYTDGKGNKISHTFRVLKNATGNSNTLYQKNNLPIVSDGKHETSVLINTQDKIWDNGFSLIFEYKTNKLVITCPELSAIKKPQLKNICGVYGVEWNMGTSPSLTSMQIAYYVYFLKHQSFPTSMSKCNELNSFIEEIEEIYKPIETNKTSKDSKSLIKTTQKYESFKSSLAKVFKEIDDTISEMNERIERISPFLIIRKEALEKQSSRYIMPLEWLMDKG